MSRETRLPSLPLPFPPRELTASPKQINPMVWVRRLVITKDIHGGQDSVIRDISLRRGLNIVWARPVERSSQTDLSVDDLLHGHAAGKTTFCRLLRFILGEPTFGTSSFQDAVKERFPQGWVLAEVCLPGEDWLVARPFFGTSTKVAFASTKYNIDELLKGAGELIEHKTFEHFNAALQQLMSVNPVPLLPSSGNTVTWLQVFQWLARDQEARFAGLDRWRDTSSESGSEKINQDIRQELIRAILSLMTPEEVAARFEEQEALKDRVSATNSVANLRILIEAETETIKVIESDRIALGIEHHIRGREESQQSASQISEGTSANDNTTNPIDLNERASEARKRAKSAADARRKVEQSCSNEEMRLEALTREPYDQIPPSKYCRELIEVAIKHNCPLIKEDRTRATTLESQRAAKAAKQEIAIIEQNIKQLKHVVEDAIREENRTQEEATRLEEMVRDAFAAWSENQRRQATYEAWERRAAEAATKLSSCEGQLRESEKALSSANGRIDQARKNRDNAAENSSVQQSYLSSLFDDIVRHFLGFRVKGELSTSAGQVRLRILEQSERNSLALSTIKVLAFDLMAIASSIESRGFHPRFLVHDSPREADIDQLIHERLFSYAMNLEKASVGPEPPFQYIVTTTAPPPIKLQVKPYLVLELDASVPAGRLLGVNL